MGRYESMNASHTAQVKLMARSTLEVEASTSLLSSSAAAVAVSDPEEEEEEEEEMDCKSSKKIPPTPRCSPLDILRTWSEHVTVAVTTP